MLDSGFQCTHEDLSSNITVYFDASNPAQAREDTVDDGHGTAVAGIVSAVAGNGIGVEGASYNASIQAVRIQGDDGSRSWDYVTDGLQYLCILCSIGRGPAVVNMSFEALSLSSGEQIATQRCLNQLYENGVVCVAASGNYDPGDEDDSLTASKYPARMSHVVSVASVDASDVVASDSNRNTSVDLCAPGVSVLSTANEGLGGGAYGYGSGTSYAAPQVAAAAALLMAYDPSMSPDTVEAVLKATARDLGPSGRDDSYGSGALDAAAAMEMAVELSSSGSGGTAGYQTSRAEVQAKIDEGYAYYLEMTR